MSDTTVGNARRTQPWGLWDGFPTVGLDTLVGELLAVAGLTAILLGVAVWNGFPITFYDTGAYVLQGLAEYFVPERAPVYSYFLRFMGGQQSLWLVAAAQCGIIAFVIVQFVRAETRLNLWRLLGLGVFLLLFTGVGWASGEIEPDCFAAVVILAMWLLAFRARAMGVVRSVLVFAIAAIAVAAHPSHMGLGAGLALVSAIYAAVAYFKRDQLQPANPFLPVGAFALGIALIVTANYALTKHVFLSRSGPVFMTARMIEDGVAKRVLDDTCPGSRFVLCRFKDHLPATADDYLWESNSPFNKLGRFRGSAKESRAIMVEGFKRYPLRELAAMTWNGTRQFFMFRTGDGVAPQEWVLNTEFRNFLPTQINAYSTARQQREEMNFMLLNIVHLTVAAAALVLLVLMLWDGIKRRDWKSVTLPAFVALGLLGNAFVCGATSGPHDRYQSRVIWVPVLVMMLTAGPMLQRSRRNQKV